MPKINTFKFTPKFVQAFVNPKDPAKKWPSRPKELRFYETRSKGLSLMLVVSYSGSLTWHAMFYRSGRSTTERLGSFNEGANDHLTIDAARKAADRFSPEKATAARKAGTFEEVAEQWLHEYVRKKRLRSEREIVRQLKTYVYPTLGRTKIHKIKRLDVNDLLADIEHKRIRYDWTHKKKKNKHHVRIGGPGQANAVLATLRSLMGWWATQDDEYTSPIVKGMERDKRSADEKTRSRVLTDDEIRAVWKACGELGIFGAFVRMLMVTAQRRNTVAAMKWSDVVDGLWTIPNSHREKGHIGAVRLPQLALDILDKQPRVAGSDYVFPAVHRGRSVQNKPINSFSERKDELDALLPDDMPEWRLHDLRRTARTRMAEIGVTDTIAERVVGHKLQGMMKVYNRHPYLDEKSDALARLADHINGIIDPRAPTGGDKRAFPKSDNVIPLSGRRKSKSDARDATA